MIHKSLVIFLVIAIVLVGCSNYDDEPLGSSNHPSISPFGVKVDEEVQLYFPNVYMTNLVKESREVNTTKTNLNNTIIEELIKGSKYGARMNLIPVNTKLQSLEVVHKVAYVSFSKDLINENYSEQEEAFLLYSIVNTLTERDEIDKVQILIEGEIKDVLSKRFTIFNPKEYSDIIVDYTYENPVSVIVDYFEALLHKKYESVRNLFSSEQDEEIRGFYSSYYQELYEEMFAYQINSYHLTGYDEKLRVTVNITLYYDEGKTKVTQTQHFDLGYERGKFRIDNIDEE